MTAERLEINIIAEFSAMVPVMLSIYLVTSLHGNYWLHINVVVLLIKSCVGLLCSAPRRRSSPGISITAQEPLEQTWASSS